jgi:4-diphosphocytidyl-2-C-methyl-D-erythritol kinase
LKTTQPDTQKKFFSARLRNTSDGSLTIHAPAKLNLGLRIFPRRPDGFHDIESWFVPISLYDTLIITQSDQLTLTLTGDHSGLSADIATNLAGKAAMALAQSAGITPRAAIRLHKLIPHGGGLGGGSSDAAAALIALNAFWQTGKTIEELQTLGLSLGSDVPFFIRATSAVCSGRGDIITPLSLRRVHYAVLVIPSQGLSTKLVYEKFDAPEIGKTSPPLNYQEISQAPTDRISEEIVNDLETPAFAVAPWLSEMQRQIDQTVNCRVHLSGSGSTLFILCGGSGQTQQIVDVLAEQFAGRCKIVPVILYRSEEFPGL